MCGALVFYDGQRAGGEALAGAFDGRGDVGLYSIGRGVKSVPLSREALAPPWMALSRRTEGGAQR